MDWVFQVLSVIVAFGPLIIGVMLWHYVWKRDGGSSSNPPPPPPSGPERRPVPPSPQYSGDRVPVVHRRTTVVHRPTRVFG